MFPIVSFLYHLNLALPNLNPWIKLFSQIHSAHLNCMDSHHLLRIHALTLKKTAQTLPSLSRTTKRLPRTPFMPRTGSTPVPNVMQSSELCSHLLVN